MDYPKIYGPDTAPPEVLRLVATLLPLLIEGTHPALSALREQYSRASIRQVELTGAGFLAEFEVPPDAPLASPPKFTGGDAVITFKGVQHGAGCVLFVRDGRLSLLDCHTYDDKWPEDVVVLAVEHVTPIQPPKPTDWIWRG